MAELYVIGQILGAKSFPDKSLFCRWKLHFGDLAGAGHWSKAEPKVKPKRIARMLDTCPVFPTLLMSIWSLVRCK
uniref:Uncharacterized protein n=1 Tax=Romanomermis culicivorax TaxID=13658 RepID=A0A915JC28_ROMCU